MTEAAEQRVAEERERLLEKLREPSEGMAFAGADADAKNGPEVFPVRIWQAMLAAFEQENEDGQ